MEIKDCYKNCLHSVTVWGSIVTIILTVGVVARDKLPPQVFTEFNVGTTFEEGRDKYLQCRANGYPLPVYRWMKDGQYISPNSSREMFEILKIKRTDSGMYQCVASNELGAIISKKGFVEVAYMELLQDTTDKVIDITQGRAVVLPLPHIESVPKPKVSWLEGTSPLEIVGGRHQVTLNGSLAILDPNINEDGFRYRARFRNGFAVDNDIQYSAWYTLNIPGNGNDFIGPELVVPISDATAHVADIEIDFECVFNARPLSSLTVLWYKVASDGSRTLIDNNNPDKYILPTYDRSLKVKNIQPADAGYYECEGVFSHPARSFPSVTARASLTVYEPPSFSVQIPSMQTRDYGQSIDFVCLTVGVPQPQVVWYFNAVPISSTDTRYQIHANGTLHVDNLDLPDAGMYQCFASNEAGEIKKSIRLAVNSSPPNIVNRPSNQTIIEGSDITFPCEVQGAPRPTVKWKSVASDGSEREIVSGGRFQILDNRNLLIAATVSTDSGLYVCNATNLRGTQSAEASLLVLVRTQIVRPPVNITAVRGTTESFLCGVTNDPKVNVTWKWSFIRQYTNIQTEIIPNPQEHIIHDDGTLEIQSIFSNDLGKYICNVISSGGNDSRFAYLDMIELPRPPVGVNASVQKDDERSATVAWTPGYDGNSPILYFKIQYKDVTTNIIGPLERDWVSFPTDIPSQTTSFVIPNLQPARAYEFRVSAINSVGEGDPSISSPVLTMPEQPPSNPPRGFFGTPYSNQSLLLQWQPPDENSWNGQQNRGYTIRYKPQGISSYHLKVLSDWGRTSYVLESLIIYQTYNLQIAAHNSKGIGTYSNEITVSTKEGHPTAPPRNFVGVAKNSTVIRLTWRVPDERFLNGENQGYKIQGRQSSGNLIELVRFIPHNALSEYQSTDLSNLLKYTNYTMSVLCYTRGGDGPPTAPITVQTSEDVPGPVGTIHFKDIKDTYVTVFWTPPHDINGVLLGYTLVYVMKNNTSIRREYNLGADIVEHKIEGLLPQTQYTIHLNARTQKGAGPVVSADIQSGVPPELPEAPTRLAYSNIESRSVLLQFRPGYNGRTSITLWIVEALEGDSTSWKKIYEKTDPNAQSITVHNLRPYTNYQLRLIAENIVGRSNASQPTFVFQTKQDAPNVPPGNVTVRAVDSTTMRVSWMPLAVTDWNGIPRGYDLYYRIKLNGSEFRNMPLHNGTNFDSHILEDLEEWMDYEVKMSAYNDVGNSPFSPITVERTREAAPSAGPTDVRVSALSSTSINVTWDEVPFMDRNGLILGYKIKYQSTEASLAAEFETVEDGERRTAELMDLRKYVRYEVAVLAFTRMGDGVLSNQVSATTFEDVPGPPIIIYFPDVDYTMAKVVWNPPLEPNGVIIGYRVSYRRKSDQNDTIPLNNTLGPLTREFTVYNLTRETEYVFSVTARTSVGWGMTAEVSVLTMINRSPPDSPKKPTIGHSHVEARSITISWRDGFNGYSPLRNYTVQFQEKNGVWETVPGVINPHVASYTITHLRPFTIYRFRVAATNDVGTSAFSEASEEQQTNQDKPEGAPENLKIVPVTTSSVKVTWDHPPMITWNGRLTKYVIEYRQSQMSSFNEETVVYPETTIVLSNLTKFVNYEVQVIAVNDKGRGPHSTPDTIYVGEAAPSATPRSIVPMPQNSKIILVKWEPPPEESQNGVLSGYKVTYWLQGFNNTANQLLVREKEVLLQNLKTFSSYGIVVQAYNLAGEGPKSSPVFARTLEGAPGVPASLTFSNISLTSLTVNWMSPVNPNGLITGYELTYNLLKCSTAESKQVSMTISGSSRSVAVDPLEENCKYKFTIAAINGVGMGPILSKNITTGPQEGSPEPPEKPYLTTSDKSVVLRWQNRQEGYSPIFAYLIQAKQSGTVKWELIIQKNSRESSVDINFRSLTPETTYRFRVIAINNIGISSPSPSSDPFTTPGPAVDMVQKPFHTEWWFLVIVALSGVIFILVVVSLLCLVARRSNAKNGISGMSLESISEGKGSKPPTVTIQPNNEPEEGGFPAFEMDAQRQSRRSVGHTRNGTAKIYARAPPRPSPGSVTYSTYSITSDDDHSMVKPPLPDDDDDDDDDNTSSVSEKPSHLGDMSGPDSEIESEIDSDDNFPPPPPLPDEPPTGASYNSDYMNDCMLPPWKQPQVPPSNAYAYTDSEASSSHYGFSFAGGTVVLDNTARSRAPFSSFV